jgi:hypothetical protein
MGHGGSARISYTYLSEIAIGLIVVIAGFNAGAVAQTSPATGAEPGRQQESSDPVLTNRPPPRAKSLVIPEGKIKLDVVRENRRRVCNRGISRSSTIANRGR